MRRRWQHDEDAQKAHGGGRMSQRRFTEKPDLDPSAVRSLPDGHPAMVENRTLFPRLWLR
jgi:hypothetical protein